MKFSRKVLGLVLLAAGCMSEKPPQTVLPAAGQEPPQKIASTVLPVVALRWEDQPVIADETGAQLDGAPMSLTTPDGSGLQIVSLKASAVIEDPLAFTELHFVFKNPEPRAIEGRFEMTLPPHATISRFAMRQDSGWQEGEVVELQAAREAYEDFLHRRVDPALLEKQGGNRFQARVFPIPASGEKEIIVSYSQELVQARDPYRLYLRGLPRLGSLDLRILFDSRDTGNTGRRAFEIHQNNFLPDRDFTMRLPAAASVARGLRRENLAVARVTPVADAKPDPIDSLLVLFDTSASRALGFTSQVERLGKLIEPIRKSAGPKMPLAVACFDQEIEPIYVGPADAFGVRELSAIMQRKPLGASDLSSILRSAAGFVARSGGRVTRALVVTDGIATAGATEANELKADLVDLRKAGIQRLDVIVDGGIRDESLLRQLAVGTFPRDGVVLDAALPIQVLADRLGRVTVSDIQVKVPGSRWVWPSALHGLQPGDHALVYAALPAGQPFEVHLSGPGGTTKHSVHTWNVERPLLERAMVQAEIRRRMDDRDRSTDEMLREQIKQEIIGLSTRNRVLSDFTGLLILETDEDYARFRIDRRALSDILVVGTAGVDLMKRSHSSPLQVAAGSPAAPPAEEAEGDFEDGEPNAVPRVAEKKKDVARAEPSKRPATAFRQSPARPGSGPTQPSPTAVPRPPHADAPRPPLAPPTTVAPPPPPPAPAPIAPAEPAQEMVRPFAAPRPAPESRPAPSPAPRTATAPPARKPKAFSARDGGGGSAGPAPAPPRSAPTARPEPRQRWSAAPGDPLAGPDPCPTCFVARPRPPAPMASNAPGRRPPAMTAADDFAAGAAAPYEGKFAQAMEMIASKQARPALEFALKWREEDPGDALALIALGEAFEALGLKGPAARAYGSLIDLFPSRADLRRFAGARLERLGTGPGGGLELAIDTYRKAVQSRPDHPSSHRLLAFALARASRMQEAFDAILAGAMRGYPAGRFRGVELILRDDVGLIGAALIKAQPEKTNAVVHRARQAGAEVAVRPSLRFVLNWETDANDVDFHILDGMGGHAFYQNRHLDSGGQLYADVTTGYGPECFAIDGRASAYPYSMKAHYYSKGPMGYGMGKLQIIEHDGKGGLKFDERPFVVMTDRAFVDLGQVTGPLKGP